MMTMMMMMVTTGAHTHTSSLDPRLQKHITPEPAPPPLRNAQKRSKTPVAPSPRPEHHGMVRLAAMLNLIGCSRGAAAAGHKRERSTHYTSRRVRERESDSSSSSSYGYSSGGGGGGGGYSGGGGGE